MGRHITAPPALNISPLIRGVCQILHLAGLLHQLHIETQALQLADQNVERFRNARFGGGFALHNCFVNLGASVDVVGLGG